MQLWHYGLGFSLALGVGLGAGGGCAAGGKGTPGGTGGGAGTGTGGSSHSNSGSGGMAFTTGSTGSTGGDAGVPDGFGACSKFSAEAKQAPAAMLIVLQRSASMATSNKWPAAQTSIVKAIDEDVFDTMSLGLTAFPVGNYPCPCLPRNQFPCVL